MNETNLICPFCLTKLNRSNYWIDCINDKCEWRVSLSDNEIVLVKAWTTYYHSINSEEKDCFQFKNQSFYFDRENNLEKIKDRVNNFISKIEKLSLLK